MGALTMSCDLNSGCKICPGIWLAVAMMAAMVIQSWWFRPTRNTSTDEINVSVTAPLETPRTENKPPEIN
jgi:hypothetical protein